MGGKRPDQYQFDPSEGRTSDHKRNPQSSQGDSGDFTNLRAVDKQQLDESKRGGQPFLPDVPAPSAEAQWAARQANEAQAEREQRDADSHEAGDRGK